nr:hypothetical protein [Tanacetum cinerariifolium]
MGRDTVQLETAINTISHEYILEFTSEYGIPDTLHPELPGPDMDLFNLIRALNPTKVKIGSRPRAAHEVFLLTLTANRVVEMDDPAVATDSSGNHGPKMPPPKDVPATDAPKAGQAEEVVVKDPLATTNSRKKGHDGADVNAPSKVLRRDHADPLPTGSTHGGKSLAAIQLGLASTRPVHVPENAPVGVSDLDPLSFVDPQSRHPAGTGAAGDPDSENASSTFAVGSPKNYFSELRHLHNDEFLRQYNVNLARQVAIGSKLCLRFEQEAKLLRKFLAQVAHRDKRIQAQELEIKNLEALLEAEADMKKATEDRSVATLQEQVSGKEKLKAAFEEFKWYEDNWVEQRCAEMDARLDALSIDFDEELYPHMLTAIAGCRWMIGRGLRLAVMKCGESLELRQAFTDVLSVGITKGMSEGLRHEALKDLKYPLMDQLKGLKDAPIDVIMAALYLESDTGNDALQHIRDLHLSSFQLTIPMYPECVVLMGWLRASRPVRWRPCICAHRGPSGSCILLADAATQTELEEAT